MTYKHRQTLAFKLFGSTWGQEKEKETTKKYMQKIKIKRNVK